MDPHVYFVVNIDSDPDPEDTPRNDAAVMEKYDIMRRLVEAHVEGKGTICVQTSPMYRDRFFESHFMDFWRAWVEAGGALTLHPEEDLYATPETRLPEGTRYEDIEHMTSVIVPKVELMKQEGLPFAAYKGGYHGLTPDIVHLLKRVGVPIDVTCAPNVVWPRKAANWGGAPLSAYYMSSDACREEAVPDEKDPIFEIPFGWDGEASDTRRRHLLDEHYLVNEFSTYDALRRVWDAIVERSRREERPQIVSILCHTYALTDGVVRDRCARILDYMREHRGTPVTATEAKAAYDELGLGSARGTRPAASWRAGPLQ